MDDPELKLVIAACRAPYGGGDAGLDDSSNVDWARLAKLAERHRVQALCWHGLGEARSLVPPAIAERLAQAAKETVGQSMRMAFESARLKETFDRAGIDLLFVKGVTLAALAYPHPFLKMSMDIDLLVAPDRLLGAASALRFAGYRPTIPASAADARLEAWHRTHKESVWRHDEAGFQLDLHTRLTDQPALLPEIGLGSPRQSVNVAQGIELPTLAGDELFAYLCVHGASSAWFRLKWACDLAALINGATPGEIDRLFEKTQQLGAGRAAAQALVLVDRLFGIDLPALLSDRLRFDRLNVWLADVALRQLTAEREPLDRTMGTMSIHLSQLFMLPGAKNLLSELGRQARSMLERNVR